MERAFHFFGAQERTTRLSYKASRENSPYLVHDALKINALDRDERTSGISTCADMMQRVGTIDRLLPADLDIAK